MAARSLRLTLGTAVACAIGISPAETLTIYRLGGADIPVPEAAGRKGVDFVQLHWADANEGLFGRSSHLEIGESLTPVRLDPGVNIGPRIRELGGRVRFHDPRNGWEEEHWTLDNLMDGDYGTAFRGYHALFFPDENYPRSIWIEFGGLFPIRRVVFQPRPKFQKSRYVQTFFIGTSDGDIRKRGTRGYKHIGIFRVVDFDPVYNVTGNQIPVVDLELPDVPIAEMLFESPRGDWEIAELEIYGDGFVSRAGYVSNVFDLGGRSSLGDLTWSGSQDPGAEIQLRMRSGDDEDPNSYWRLTFRGEERTRFDRDGRLLDRFDYDRLESGEKAGIRPDRENWGYWTGPLDFDSGRSDLVGGKPRGFLQIKADFFSTGGSAGSALDFLRFEVTKPPVASEVLAEIFPREVQLGEVTTFTYKLLARIRGDDLGFDSIQINSPQAPAGVDEVRIGSKVLTPGEFDVTPYDGGSFSVHVPHVDLQGSDELIEVVFRSEVFKVGTVFSGKVYNSALPMEVRQRVTEGDADPLTEGNSLSVVQKTAGARIIRALDVSPFTPNADGVNDLLQVEYVLVNLEGDVPAALEVFNLAGVRMAGIPAGPGFSGRFSTTWDGRGEQGRLLLPGLYLMRLKVEADEATETRGSVFYVTY